MPSLDIKEFIKKNLSSTPPEPCDLSVGDVVTFTNDYEVVFAGLKVIGFARKDDWFYQKSGRFIHIDTDCFWLQKKREQLKKEVMHERKATL